MPSPSLDPQADPHSRALRRSRRRGGTLLAVAAAALALGACGGEEDTEATGAAAGGGAAVSGGPSNDQDAARVRLVECLRENGVDLPDDPAAGGRPPNFDRDKAVEALNGPCADLQAEAFGDAGGTDDQEFQDDFAKFAECMRGEGVDLPDRAGGGRLAGGGGIDPDDPTVQAAIETCQDLRPRRGGGFGG